MNEELKPCPFCGVDVELLNMTDMRHPPGECILAREEFDRDQWNTRTQEPSHD